MGRSRQRFYDLFSRCYDGFVRLHSGDEGQRSRAFLVEQLAPQPGDRLLDLCTGTGDVALKVALAVGAKGQILGLDLSRGMLRKARQKQEERGISGVHWIQGNAARLPLRTGAVEGVTCSHALYEVKGSDREEALKEVVRVLAPGGRFCLMEHALPTARIPRSLLRLRSIWTGGMGTGVALPDKVRSLHRGVYLLTPGGRSWVMVMNRVREKVP